MLYGSRAPGGGMALGLGAFGAALWVQREPICHRWNMWTTHRPNAAISCGDDPGFGALGVREPRRPLPGLLGGEASVQPGGHRQ
jgi:hypothetical protein